MSDCPRYLLDVNLLIALTSTTHVHHRVVKQWFNASSDLKWSLCAFTEAGFVRASTATRRGHLSMSAATAILNKFAQHHGCSYLPITVDWQTLCSPFFKRLYGTNQVTDAYLLGLAVREGLVLATMDKAILHLAGDEYRSHVLLLEAQ